MPQVFHRNTYTRSTVKVMKDPKLIFLISQPRAGSTLLQFLLDNSPKIHTLPEPWISLPFVSILKPELHNKKYNSVLCNQAVNEFLSNTGKNRNFLSETISKSLKHLYKAAAKGHSEKGYFLDKTPRYYFIIDELKELFPQAKFILLMRNPVEVLNSILDTWVKEEWSYLLQYRYDLLTAPNCLIQAKEKICKNTLSVSYEKLLDSPEDQIKRILKFLDLPSDKISTYYDNDKFGSSKFGDPTGIRKQKKVSKKKKEFSKKNLPLLSSYMKFLGKQKFEALGYSYEETEKALDKYEFEELPFEIWPDLKNDSPAIKDWLNLYKDCERRDLDNKKITQVVNSFLEENDSVKLISSVSMASLKMQQRIQNLRNNLEENKRELQHRDNVIKTKNNQIEAKNTQIEAKNRHLEARLKHMGKLADDLSDSQNLNAALIEKSVINQLKFLSAKKYRIALFANGAHTKWFLNIIRSMRENISVIFDEDCMENESYENIKVLKPKEHLSELFDIIIPSSDTIEEHLCSRIDTIFDNVKVHRLYEGLPPGPYKKNSN